MHTIRYKPAGDQSIAHLAADQAVIPLQTGKLTVGASRSRA
jgi:hypothetical protein